MMVDQLLTLHATLGLLGSGVEPESLRIAVEIGANSRYGRVVS